MVERFNQNLKLVILASYAAGQDTEEEVEKYVAPIETRLTQLRDRSPIN